MSQPGLRRRTKTGASTQRRPGRVTSAVRFAQAAAERHLTGNPAQPDPGEQNPEFDDAPPVDDLPEWQTDEDDELNGPNEDADYVVPPRLLPWVRLTIFDRNGVLDYRIHLPAATDPDIDRSLEELRGAWTQTARDRLIRYQGAALGETALLSALLKLAPYAMRDLERSVGQGSRDRRVLISTPFGLVPLWFFAMGRHDHLFRDLAKLGRWLQESGEPVTSFATRAGSLRTSVISEILPHATEKEKDSIRSAHSPTLVALLHRPEVLATHRARWPLTTPEALVDDLGVTGRSGRSNACAVLALAGAFDPEALLVSTVLPRPRPRGLD